MTESEIRQIVEKQRRYFQSGATLDVSLRMQALEKLKACILRYEAQIYEALKKDLGKSNFESYMCEVGLALSEISYMQKHVRSFSREKRVHTPLAQFHAKSYRKPSPYGVTLIMSPWNYPFLLTIDPLADALAAGNTAVLKPSAYSPATSSILKQIVEACFDEDFVAVVTGGHAENSCLLEQHFDYIFFTGSQAVGKEVMRHAADHLTPVTLELGGKSPCLVEKSANLKLAARRIVFGKFLNCGQTCVAPDYVYCDRQIKDALVAEIKKEIVRQFGNDPLANTDYGKIINEKHFQRILGLIDETKVVHGGNSNEKTQQIAPTVMDNVTFSDAVMQDEIFGPIMPILTYNTLTEAICQVQSGQHPLALYVFTQDKAVARKITESCSFGGGCINDTVIHLATSEMGFGGFGESGMGSYHGKDGFDTFSHYKSIVDKKTWLDLPMRYQPYLEKYRKVLRAFLK